MRTTLTINDDLYAKAVELTGIHEKSTLFNKGIKALIEKESAKRLALLGGSQPELSSISRRQTDID